MPSSHRVVESVQSLIVFEPYCVPFASRRVHVKGSKARLWTGEIHSGFAVLFSLMNGVGKLVKPVPVIEGTTVLGWSEGHIITLGMIVLIATGLYLIPR
jgi:hypothetical protein